MRVHYPKSRPYYLPLNVFIASKGSNLYILFTMIFSFCLRQYACLVLTPITFDYSTYLNFKTVGRASDLS